MSAAKLLANGLRLYRFSTSNNSALPVKSTSQLLKFPKTNSFMAKPSITIGGKSTSLSSTSLYSISHNFYPTQIDSSALAILLNSKAPKASLPLENLKSSSLTALPLQLSRAALVVLLNKLLISDSRKSPFATLIERTLNSKTLDFQTLDFGSSFGFVKYLCEINGLNADEIGITKDEVEIIEKCCAELIGICGVLDCGTSALIRVCDAVAGLSCEAARADVAVAFDFSVPGDGFSDKDKIDVAGELKTLLFGSKLAGNVAALCFSEIPSVHGSFREAVRMIHKKVRVELNTGLNVKKGSSGSSGAEESLSNSVLSLASSFRSVGKCSLGRMKFVVESISDVQLRLKVAEVLEKECPSLEVDSSVLEKLVFRIKYVEGLCGLYDMFVKLREVLAWEAALALFVIENDESIDKGQVGNTVIGKVNEIGKDEKKEKKKKNKSLGKGTMIVRQLLKERLKSRDGTNFNPTILVEWARELSLYFDPKDLELDTFLSKLKEIVESNEVRRLPKIPKGTRDFGKEQMAIRERAFAIITSVFKRHGAVALDTPVFELRETLMGKYGEDSKLIYDLADQGGELCSLRYDLTVPFARYLAMNNISSLKRYQIAKVYRRDNPSKGRYREFYQCDLDIAGQYETMEPDFEVVKVLTELLDELQIGDYEVKLNHRKLLDAMLDICGVPSEKFRTVCSSIDKLDKQSFEQIKKELVEEKGLSSETADKIGSLVKKRGAPLEVLSDLKGDGSEFMGNSGSVVALQELEILFRALQNAKCLDKVVFDLSLARGLDYYTGVIFEAVFKGAATQVGSIAAGGRYDNLVGMFSGKQVPAVGVSLGIERVFTIMEQIEKDRNQLIRATETEVLVAILSKDIPLAAERVSELWGAEIKAEFGCNKRVMNHINRAKQSGIPWMVIIGESELTNGVVKLKNIEENKEEEFPRDEIVEELRKRLRIV